MPPNNGKRRSLRSPHRVCLCAYGGRGRGRQGERTLRRPPHPCVRMRTYVPPAAGQRGEGARSTEKYGQQFFVRLDLAAAAAVRSLGIDLGPRSCCTVYEEEEK